MRILITGSGSGIGAGIAEYLAAAGHEILVSDYALDATEAVQQKIQSAGGDCKAIKLDVTCDDDLDAIAQMCAGKPVDVLINNAGVQHVAPLEDFPRQQWRRLVDILLTGTALTTQAVLPAMKQQNFGRIINVGSLHSVVASPFKTAYVAAKHGLLGFSKTLALELADSDITINTICPAYVRTPLVEKQIADQAKSHNISEAEVVQKIMLEPMPKKSFIEMDELGGAAAFLISPAARNMTAQEIILDGGWTAR